ncbi:DUF1648 domain-containing protein [Adlercreutzia agrestimuris]|uniref:DUF1648 domain-containing protein n=1 Tax=Adlercreutzia agrestimuris TaxID=2941324 RepID=UPI00203A70F6|nr:DUF1648 domain-containing protein [Adlercreutzia agrestimuris]
MPRQNEQYFTPFFRVVEFVSWLLLIVSLIYTISQIKMMPDQVPTHFGFNGQPDSYGSPWTYVFIPLIMLACFALISGVGHFVPPRLWNAPPKLAGSTNFRWYKTSVGVMVLCEFELSVYTLYLQHLLISQQTSLIVPISIALLVVLLGSVAVVTWRGVRP